MLNIYKAQIYTNDFNDPEFQAYLKQSGVTATLVPNCPEGFDEYIYTGECANLLEFLETWFGKEWREATYMEKVRSVPVVGVQLTFRKIDPAEIIHVEEWERVGETNWALTDTNYFGDNTDPLFYQADSWGFREIYDGYIRKGIEPYLLQRIEQEDNSKYKSNIHDWKIEIPVLLSYEYIPDVDFESGIDEGSFEFEYIGILR